jgi:hypothetical protein
MSKCTTANICDGVLICCNYDLRSVFVLESDLELPPELISLVRLLLLPLDEWTRARDKGKPPKPKADLEALNIIHDVLAQRLKGYPTTVKVHEYVFCYVYITVTFSTLGGRRQAT